MVCIFHCGPVVTPTVSSLLFGVYILSCASSELNKILKNKSRKKKYTWAHSTPQIRS